jgi:hypothetical protein
MFDDLLSINFMLAIFLFVSGSVVLCNVIAAVISGVLSIVIKARKL